MNPPAHPITTARLHLEPLREAHAGEIAAQYLDERLWTYFPRLRPADAAAVQERFRRWSAGPPADAPEVVVWENWVAFTAGTRTAVGTFQATILCDEPAGLAYAVFPQFWRRGYGIEATRAVVRHLRSEHGVERIAAEMDARNAASIAVATRLGLREVAREAVWDERTGARGTEFRYEGDALGG